MRIETNETITPSGTFTPGDPLKVEILEALYKFIRQRPGLEFGNYGDVSSYRAEVRSIGKDLREARLLLRKVELHHSITGQDILDASRRAFSGRLKIEVVRAWECGCGNKYTAPVEHSDTANLSGEATAWCPKCGARPLFGSPHKIKIDYCTGQYWPTEYRRAVCSVAASTLWDWVRSRAMPPENYKVEWKNERGEWVPTLPLFDDAKEAEAYAATIREQKEREGRTAFDTVPHGYGMTLVFPRVRGLSPGDWLRRYFRREFGRGIASRWFN